MNKKGLLAFLFFTCTLAGIVTTASAKDVIHRIYSPDKKIEVLFSLKDNVPYYQVSHKGKVVLLQSKLGLIREDADFTNGFTLSVPKVITTVNDTYTSNNAKKSTISYKANQAVFNLTNPSGKKLDIIFRVSNDGVGFRYYFPERSGDVKRITKEVTSYNFPDTAKAWVQPLAAPKSGWEHTNPSYEENYLQGVAVGTPSPMKHGWVYPALFRSNNTWVLITEASLDSSFCGSRITNDSASAEYVIDYPTAIEAFTGKGVKPQSTLPWYSPWRIITIGTLKTIVESTLGTDLAAPSIKIDKSFVRPGKASWSWINSKDNWIVFSEQKKYIDFAQDMNWQYCLIDVNWDKKIGYDSIKILADYARQNNVGLLLWYSSSGDWNTVKYTPKSVLLTAESRSKEFSRLRELGIKGVKIDFFGGDGQSMIQYYHDILNDAAKYQLLVNFHGATLPRGWHRTYPNLLTTEAVKGFEMVTFDQGAANAEANHCAMLPFTRNVFDPMDFTPMNLHRIQTGVRRRTTSAFELATSVLFLSGIQHFAESPEGMNRVPEFAKDFLRTLPVSWDDVRFLDGFPGKDAVVARRKGTKWYVAGINGEGSDKTFNLNLSFLGIRKGKLIADAEGEKMFEQQDITAGSKTTILVKPNGGFVAVF